MAFQFPSLFGKGSFGTRRKTRKNIESIAQSGAKIDLQREVRLINRRLKEGSITEKEARIKIGQAGARALKGTGITKKDLKKQIPRRFRSLL